MKLVLGRVSLSMLLLAAFGITQDSTWAQPPPSLKAALEDVHVGDRWTYNDWESAKLAAAKSKKPILALFR